MTSMTEPKTCRTCERSEPDVRFSRKSGRRCVGCFRRARHCGLAHRFHQAKRRAGQRGKQWTLTRDEFAALTEQPCTYCGDPDTTDTSGSGLDRRDSSRGYHLDNVVPCCVECNLAKGPDTFSYEEMLVIGAAIRQVKDARLR